MSLSSSTLILFIFLIPGMVFRYVVYYHTIVKRPISSGNAIHIIVSILTLSIIVQLLGFLAFWMISEFSAFIFNYDYKLGLAEFDGKLYLFHDNVRLNITNFVIKHYWLSLTYLVAIIITSLLTAFIFGALSRRVEGVGRILFGPLSPVLTDPISPVVQCFVLTKICHGSNRMIYGGYAVEVALKDGSNIDHIVLENPEKFYFRMNKNKPSTTFEKAIPVNGGYYGGLMYIAGDEIENVHFDHFYI